MSQPKIFVFDIETAPILANVWSRFPKFVGSNQIIKDWYMLSWAGKWLGEDEVIYDACSQYKELDDWATNDYYVVASLREMLAEADWVIAHNGIKFDMRKFNARLIHHGMAPLPPVKMIDTLKEVKRVAQFTDHSLNYLCQTLIGTQKVETGGHELWVNCQAGIQEAWDTMIEYNIGDIDLLEGLYLYLRPYMKVHPNWSLYTDEETETCPRCGGTHIKKRGFAYTSLGKFQRFVCDDCGAWSRSRFSQLTKEKRKGLLTNAL